MNAQLNLINTVAVVTRNLHPKPNSALLYGGVTVAFVSLFMAFFI